MYVLYVCLHILYMYHLKQEKNPLLTLSGFSFKYGGSPSTISIAIIPKLQMSTYGGKTST